MWSENWNDLMKSDLIDDKLSWPMWCECNWWEWIQQW